MTHTIECDLCGADLTYSGQFLLLNRCGIGADGSTMFLEFSGKRTQAYHWDHEAQRYSGRALCWPQCASLYIDGLLVEKHYEEKHGG